MSVRDVSFEGPGWVLGSLAKDGGGSLSLQRPRGGLEDFQIKIEPAGGLGTQVPLEPA